MSLALALCGLASVIHLHAASLAGVTLPHTAQIGNTTLWCSMAWDYEPSTW